MTTQQIQQLKRLVSDLGWDYDRLTDGGQRTLDQIQSILNSVKGA